jgi:CRP-like cAMP-binding protein
MTELATVRLLDVEPDLGRYLTTGDIEALEGVPVPALDVPAGELDVAGLMASHRAFGLVVLGGLIVRRLVLGDAATLRLLGPGDVLGAAPGFSSTLVTGRSWAAAAPTRFALLDRDVLLASHRAPRLVAGLHARAAEQVERIALQLAVCQLPRVEDRVLTMLWLLAESWGQVTAHGTSVRLHLTHETLGGLVGARRSTVTLALGELTERGALMRQDRGWLLLERPAPAEELPVADPLPELLDPLAAGDREPAGTDPINVSARVGKVREMNQLLVARGEEAGRRLALDLRRLGETRRVSEGLRAEARVWRDRARSRVAVARLHHDDDARDGLGPVER